MYSFLSTVLFYVLFACKCVLVPPVVNPTAVKYIISQSFRPPRGPGVDTTFNINKISLHIGLHLHQIIGCWKYDEDRERIKTDTVSSPYYIRHFSIETNKHSEQSSRNFGFKISSTW